MSSPNYSQYAKEPTPKGGFFQRTQSPRCYLFFLAPAFFAAGFFATGFFLATTFLAAAFFFAGAAFFAAGFAGAAGRLVLIFGALTLPRAMSLKPFRAVILATFFAFTLICSPVAGLRAMRAGRWTFANFANPDRLTTSPLATVAKMTSIVPSTTRAAVLLSTSA